MQLIDSLRREHVAIERVALAFLTFARLCGTGGARAGDGERFVRFFRLYAGRFHHGREEDVLFPALARETEAPLDRGPIKALLGDHEAMGATLHALEPLLAATAAFDPAHLVSLATTYVTALVHHIDAEGSVLFPEAEARFRRASVLALDDREPDAEERAAHDDAVSLADHYAAADLPGLVRGDGCVCCPRFGVECQGVERDWSTDLEWDDMIDRVG